MESERRITVTLRMQNLHQFSWRYCPILSAISFSILLFISFKNNSNKIYAFSKKNLVIQGPPNSLYFISLTQMKNEKKLISSAAFSVLSLELSSSSLHVLFLTRPTSSKSITPLTKQVSFAPLIKRKTVKTILCFSLMISRIPS